MAAAPLRPAGTAGKGYASAFQQSSSRHHGDASLLPSNTDVACSSRLF